jgi:hypothetical protein
VNVIDDSSSPSQIKDQVVSNPPPPLSASPLGAKTAANDDNGKNKITPTSPLDYR